ncbi:MAG: aspartate-semialdehyde dehydrogenase [Candidatus Rhabdochlamydia sp.]
MTIAIVGATGAVGQEILTVLEKRAFPLDRVRCFASLQSVGKTVVFRGEKIEIEPLTASSLQGVQLAFFAAGKAVSLQFAQQAADEGCLIIDSSSAFRMDPSVPLVIPEINLHHLKDHQGVIASPNCTATAALMALFPLHQKAGLKRVVISTYQAASGAGYKGMKHLEEESQAVLNHTFFKDPFFPHPYAFNLFTHNSPMTQLRYNEEEMKIIEESRKILDLPHLKMAVTCVRVPVMRAHSLSINAEFTHPLLAQEAHAILATSAGIFLLEDWERNRFPMPSDASGHDLVFAGRIRNDLSQDNTLDLWVVADQLLKGAALNAVQIAEAACGYAPRSVAD